MKAIDETCHCSLAIAFALGVGDVIAVPLHDRRRYYEFIKHLPVGTSGGGYTWDEGNNWAPLTQR